MNTTNNYTSLQPLLFDFSSLAYSYNLTEKENEFASLWNDIVSKVPDSLFEINTFGRKGYPLSTILAVRVIMLFFKKGNISEALREIEASCNLKAITGINAHLLSTPHLAKILYKPKDKRMYETTLIEISKLIMRKILF